MTSGLRTRRLRYAAALTVCIALTAACSGIPKASDTGKPVLKVAAAFLPANLDPAKGIDAVFSFAESLTRVDGKGQVQPLLLARLPERQQPNRWRITLRDGITFQDGRRTDAEAVAASLARSLRKSPAAKASLDGTTFAADGPLDVIVTTARPRPLLPYALADISFAIHDVAVAEAAGDSSDGWIGKGAFTAPYQITAFSPREMRLSAYDGYWQGKPAMGEIRITHVPEAQARVAAVQSGQVDIADGANVPDVLTAIQGSDDVHLRLSEAPLSSVRLMFNTKAAPLDDEAVRRALALGMDYTTLAAQFTGGVGEPASSLLPASDPLAVRAQQSDTGMAAGLLDQAGWTRSDNGVRQKGGERLTVTLLGYTERSEFQPLSIGIQTQLKALGVEVKIVSQPFDYKMYDDVNRWDLALYSEYAISPTGAPDAYLTTYLATDGSANLWRIGDKSLDGMLDRLQKTGDNAERRSLLGRIQQHTFSQAYLSVLAFEKDGALVTRGYKDYVPGSGYQYAMWDWKTAPSS